MGTDVSYRHVVRFGAFEADLQTGELCKSGRKIRLQEKPFQILALLLERPGEIVTHDEVRHKLWNGHSSFDFDHSAANALNRLRAALGDSADNPRFVETIPRRGYRFVAPVQVIGKSQAEDERKRHRLVRQAPWVVATAAAILAIWSWVRWDTRSPLSHRLSLLTSYSGEETHPTFSPDGNEIAFAWNGEEPRNFEIYRQLLGPGETRLRLTNHPAADYSPAWSPDGRWIAFLRTEEEPVGSAYVAAVMLVSPLGGHERQIAVADVTGIGPGHPASNKLTWSAGSDCLIVPDIDPESGKRGLFRISVSTGEKAQLTTGRDVGPAVSPDGEHLAFIRIAGFAKSDLYITPLSVSLEAVMQPRRLNGDVRVASSAAWSADGKEVLFIGSRQGVRTLWRVAANGRSTPRRLPLGEGAAFFAVAPGGGRLTYALREWEQDIWRLPLNKPSGGSAVAERFLSSSRQEWWPRYSPDGRMIAFQSSRSGLHQIWICNSDGSGLRQLTQYPQGFSGSPRWSPDGKWIAFDSNAETEEYDVFVVGIDGGPARNLTDHAAFDYRPAWSNDGQWIYFHSDRSGSSQIWKIPSEGGAAVQMTRGGAYGVIQESPDSTVLYFEKDAGRSLHSLRFSTGEESEILNPVAGVGSYVATDRGVYFLSPDGGGRRHLRFLNFTTGETGIVSRLEGRPWTFTVSPDERTLLFAQPEPVEADLMLVENFR